MMRWIVGSSLKSKGLVVALGIGVLVLGVAQMRKMPRDVLPEFSPVTVEVQTEALGLSAEEVEQLVTVPLEQDLLSGVAFLDAIRSESVPGLSRVELIFEPGTAIARARQVVNERLTQAGVGLTSVSKVPQMLQPRSSTSRVMMMRLSSETQSLIDLGVLARWTVRPRLMAVPGVANVSIWGQREQQLQVQVDPEQLQAQGVSLDQVIRTAGNALWASPLTFLEASTPGAGGFFDTQTQRIGVEHTQPISTPEDLAKIRLESDPNAAGGTDAGTNLTLDDVSNVVENHQPLIGDAVFTDGPGLLVVVEKFPEANAVEVTEELDRAIATLQPGLTGIDVDTSFFRPARYVESAGDNLRTALLIGLIVLAIALLALLFNLRSAFVVLVSTLLSMAAAIIVLYARGETLNAMVLAGLVLALAVVIDDAVLGVDSIRRASTVNGALRALVATRGPLLYGTAILGLSLVPVLVLDGELGAFFPALVLSYAVAVVASLLVALTVTPALSLLLRANDSRALRESPVIEWVRPRYQRVSSRVVTGRAGLALAGVLILVGLAVLPALSRGDSTIPEFKDRDMLIQLSGAPGTSLPEMNRIAARAGQELRGIDGVANVGGHVGRAILGDQTVNVNSGELWVSLDDSAEYGKAVDAIEAVVTGYPGIDGSVLTYPRERINDVLKTPDGVEGKDLTVRVFGYTAATLRDTADKVRDEVAKVDGTEAPSVELPVVEPTLQVEVDLDKAQALGLNPGDIRRAAATVLSGIEVGSLFEEQKIFEVVVWGTPETRHSLDDVTQLKIDRPDGAGQVTLGEVANVSLIPSATVIQHEGTSRSIDVGVNVSGRDIDAVASDIDERIRNIEYPLEYHAELLGDYEDRQSARLTFIGVTVAATVGIFLLLQAAFASWRMASVLFVALPGALAGGVIAAAINGGDVTIGTFAGFLVVFALAARHSVLLVRHGQQLEDGGEAFGPELVEHAVRDRLASTIASAVATLALFVPMLFFGGRAGFEVVHPMAVVVVGGLVTSTALTLLVVPSLYHRFGLRKEGSREPQDLVIDLTTPEQPADAVRTPSTVDA
jgi:Cu/Ag efflux pump CusA